MTLQKSTKPDQQTIDNWENSALTGLFNSYINILMLPLKERKYAFSQIEKEMSAFFIAESTEDLKRVNELRFKLKCATDKKEISIFKTDLFAVLNDIENKTLGLEHFFRELSKLYELSSFVKNDHLDHNNRQRFEESLKNLAQSYGELFLDGHPIELLNGELGEMPSSWITAICNQITHKQPKLRIFVISIIGLQSSGKSTLLNALFGCKFAVSVGRCTRGLYMRLLLLEEGLFCLEFILF